jgi:hypothetical protein
LFLPLYVRERRRAPGAGALPPLPPKERWWHEQDRSAAAAAGEDPAYLRSSALATQMRIGTLFCGVMTSSSVLDPLLPTAVRVLFAACGVGFVLFGWLRLTRIGVRADANGLLLVYPQTSPTTLSPP